MNECSFPSILPPAALPRKCNKHREVRRASHTHVILRTCQGTQTSGLFLAAGGVLGGRSVFRRRGLSLGSFGLALGRRGRRGSVSARRARTTCFLGVVGNVPAGALELHSRRREQLLHLSPAMRADGQRLVRKLLDTLGQAVALLTLIFVKRQYGVPNRSTFIDSIFRSRSGSIEDGWVLHLVACPLKLGG